MSVAEVMPPLPFIRKPTLEHFPSSSTPATFWKGSFRKVLIRQMTWHLLFIAFLRNLQVSARHAFQLVTPKGRPEWRNRPVTFSV